jgi:transglutaminase-like putative cysteine protease
VIYKIRHLTAYSYNSVVASAKLALRVTPREEAGQHIVERTLNIVPVPASIVPDTDFYGNVVHVVTIETPHKKLSIEAKAVVDVHHAANLSTPGLAWETVANEALSLRDLTALAPAHFIFPSPRIVLSSDITKYVRESFSAGREIYDACRDLIRRIKKDFAYEPETTEISTSATQAFSERRGVCQDFAHIMIAGLRGLGLPAAYVSGYIRTVPPPGKERLKGADATHAWVSVWCGPLSGWVGFDPTNAVDVADDHIALAIGRDYSDVSPVYGVFVGSGAQKLEVEVDVIPAGLRGAA